MLFGMALQGGAELLLDGQFLRRFDASAVLPLCTLLESVTGLDPTQRHNLTMEVFANLSTTGNESSAGLIITQAWYIHQLARGSILMPAYHRIVPGTAPQSSEGTSATPILSSSIPSPTPGALLFFLVITISQFAH